MTFQGRLIRHGGVFPVRVLRLFRHGCGQCENRWMDEHIKVAGPTVDFKGELIDDNLNSLTWWTDKHNKYASREAVDLLNLQYHFMPRDTVASLRGGAQAGVTVTSRHSGVSSQAAPRAASFSVIRASSPQVGRSSSAGGEAALRAGLFRVFLGASVMAHHSHADGAGVKAVAPLVRPPEAAPHRPTAPGAPRGYRPDAPVRGNRERSR